MEHKIGNKVSPIIQPDIEMLIDTIQISSCDGRRYHCHWFVEGEAKDSWFGAQEIQSTTRNGDIGFNARKKQ